MVLLVFPFEVLGYCNALLSLFKLQAPTFFLQFGAPGLSGYWVLVKECNFSYQIKKPYYVL